MNEDTEYVKEGGAISPRQAGIDLLRAVAILWVTAYHLDSPDLPLPALARQGWMGVDLFFVLSGYLIGLQLLRPYGAGGQPDWLRFFQRRAWRILPSYCAVLALYLLVPAWRESAAMAPLWQFLTFTANLFPDYARQRAFSHAWSLCVEEHFYLLLPPLVWWLARAPSARRVAWCAGTVFVGGMLLRGWAWHDAVGPALAAGGNGVLAYVERIYNPTWNRLDGLGMGVMLAAVHVFRPVWWRTLMARGPQLLLAGCLGLAASLSLDFTSRMGALFGFPLLSASLACLVLGCISEHSWPGRWRLPGAHALATLAFSLYLTHKQVYHAIDAAMGDSLAASSVLAFCAHNAAALLAAALLYCLVERPGLRWRAWLETHHLPAVAVAGNAAFAAPQSQADQAQPR